MCPSVTCFRDCSLWPFTFWYQWKKNGLSTLQLACNVRDEAIQLCRHVLCSRFVRRAYGLLTALHHAALSPQGITALQPIVNQVLNKIRIMRVMECDAGTPSMVVCTVPTEGPQKLSEGFGFQEAYCAKATTPNERSSLLIEPHNTARHTNQITSFCYPYLILQRARRAFGGKCCMNTIFRSGESMQMRSMP